MTAQRLRAMSVRSKRSSIGDQRGGAAILARGRKPAPDARGTKARHYNCLAHRMLTSTQDELIAMDPSEIYAKTELGLQELRDRKLNLPITLRGLLILID